MQKLGQAHLAQPVIVVVDRCGVEPEREINPGLDQIGDRRDAGPQSQIRTRIDRQDHAPLRQDVAFGGAQPHAVRHG